MRFLERALFALGLNFICPAIYAQQTALDTVTVTASMRAEKISRTGRNISIIKGDIFNDLPVHSIDELLRYVPGVEIQSRGAMGAQSDIVLRGGTFQQVLIMLDGIRLNDPNTGHFNSYIPIAPAEIERIEVLKGASSALYGSEAVGGVIHIITKSFAARQGQKIKEVSGLVAGGSYDFNNANFGGFYNDGETAVGGGLLANNAKGQQQRGITGYFHNYTASLAISRYVGKNWNIALRTAYDSRKFAAQNFYTTFLSDTGHETVASLWNQLSIRYQKDKSKITINSGYKNVEDDYHFNNIALANNNKSKLFQLQVNYEQELNDKSTVVTGVQYQDKSIRSNDRGDHRLDGLAGFVLLNQQIARSLHISPSLRLDWTERTGTELVPQINISYEIARWQLRGSAGKTIRDADFTERFNNYNKSLVTGGSIGNPDLEPERSFSYEAGADYFGKKGLSVSFTFFQRRQTKLIDWVPTPYSAMPRKSNLSPTGNYALSTNIAKVNTTGAETDLQFVRQINKKQQCWAMIGLTWLDSHSSEPVTSFYILSHAKFLANFSFRYSISHFSISLNGIYKNRESQTATSINATISADYFVCNAKAEWRCLKGKLSVFAQADNVFDKKYSDLLGSQMPGRWCSGGLKLMFKTL